jgi:Ohr subfamily peroxiredoxin
MKTLYTAQAFSRGGRQGTVWSSDRLLNVTLGSPLQPGAEDRGPSPELLFAGAYAACFHGALRKVAELTEPQAVDSTVRALVSLCEDDDGGSYLTVEMHARFPGIDPDELQRYMASAHRICPYSKALLGGATVTLVVDGPADPVKTGHLVPVTSTADQITTPQQNQPT